jgi:hypothetical protein
MAAMFQAQTANWEETQEKMSQLVSPASAGFLFCSRSVYLMNAIFFCLSIFPVPSASTIIPEEPVLVVVENHNNPSRHNQIDLYHPATCVTDAAKKVR